MMNNNSFPISIQKQISMTSLIKPLNLGFAMAYYFQSIHTCHFTNLSPLHTWWWLDLALNSHMPIITHFCNNQLVCWNLATLCICSHTFYSVQWYTIGRTNFILFLVSKELLWTSFHKITFNKHGHNTI